MAREAADDHLDVGDFNLSGFSLFQDFIDIFVDYGILAKAVHIAACRELTILGSGWFPLIGPNGAKGSGGLHVEIWITRVSVAFEAQTKSADASKKLGDFDL